MPDVNKKAVPGRAPRRAAATLDTSDPRTAIRRLEDFTPILLMPVRLETRFKTIGPAHELWVRVYPDDCWIDTFDPVLTDTEVRNARAYWVAIWQAGGIEAQERAAWRGLVESHGAGRAAWIADRYVPVNVTAKPSKVAAQDVILTIPTDIALPAAEAKALAAFRRVEWLADGAAGPVTVARQTLDTAVGAARAQELVRDYVPATPAPLPIGVKRADVKVGVAFVVFGPIETKPTAWAHAPRIDLLPERFVFIGYRGTDPPQVVVGQPVSMPLDAGPDPGAPEEEQIRNDEDGNLIVPEPLRWLTDFDRAVDAGMGLRVPLTAAVAASGFDRVVVVGVRIGDTDPKTGASELDALLRHHAHSQTGFSLVPLGTPTNNTDAVRAGGERDDEADRSFDDRKAPQFTPDADWLDKRDGQWLAEYLGLDPASFAHVRHAGGTDQLCARAMHAALWPATFGYWMESMLAPVFPRDIIARTRDFFTRYVLGAGVVPAIRIGAQPYGILPVTTFSRMGWLDQNLEASGLPTEGLPPRSYLVALKGLLNAIETDWRAQLPTVPFVGKDGDPHDILLDVLGLHPGSVEWSQRQGEGLMTLFNRMNLAGFGGFGVNYFTDAPQRLAARQLLTSRGYAGTATPPIVDTLFSGTLNRLKGAVVDDRPPSDVDGIRVYTQNGKNYVQWLIDAAKTSFKTLYAQDQFIGGTPPAALLYLLLRHALQLGYHEVSVALHEAAGLFNAAQAAAARGDDPFLHVHVNRPVSESRYQPLFAVQQPITGNATTRVADFITGQLGSLPAAGLLREQLGALERLKGQPTARLERAFTDHLDCCSYRLDAWRLGLVHAQLAMMRHLRDGVATSPKPGLFLGAYGWLEPLRPKTSAQTPVVLDDHDLAETFMSGNQAPLMRDPTNQGYVHAPSLNQATAAAVLRNGFLSNATPQNHQMMAVNLTSARVRTALTLIEGIRTGQSLADLLGYQFERGLHDRHGLAEVDKFIAPLRKVFPLRGDHLASTKTSATVAIEAIEARNVIDGLALVTHMKDSGSQSYPFGKTGLPPATNAERTAIDAEAARLLDAHDAVADLALAEGVYQALLGNYDRVASTYDAYARGQLPPDPDIVRTPRSGVSVTCRVAVHLPAGASATASPITGIAMTPRAQAEPAVNQWLAAHLPPFDTVGCAVTFRQAATGAMTTAGVTLQQLGLQPADLVTIVRDDARQAMTELDDRVMRVAMTQLGARPDVPVTIQYRDRRSASVSVFEIMALLRYLRRITTTSRPLAPADLSPVSDAQSGQDGQPFIDKQRIVLVRTALATLRTELAASIALVKGRLDDLPARREEIVTGVDAHVSTLTALLARAATFGIPQSGGGFAYEFLGRAYAGIQAQVAALIARWDGRLAECDAAIAEHDGLSEDMSDAERLRVLRKAERAISTAALTPSSPQEYRAAIVTLRAAFVGRRQQFVNLQASTSTEVSALRAAVLARLPIADVDATGFSLDAQDDEIVRFAEDAVRVAAAVLAAIDDALKTSQARLDAHDVVAAPADRVHALEDAAKALLGPDFRLVPRFMLTPARGDELQHALDVSRSGTLFSHLTHPADSATTPIDFPVDTWLHGVARVRDKMHAWEQMTLLAGGAGATEPVIEALQWPVRAGDKWLGLALAPGQPLDSDTLLYTAQFSTAFDKAAAQCGLLVDEWTEIIPGETVETGLTFHHDRPNAEAPQSMLLVTPSLFQGRWEWDDVIAAVNETLDLAKLRAIEPKHVDKLPYAPFLPATIAATQARQLTIAANLALNNAITLEDA